LKFNELTHEKTVYGGLLLLQRRKQKPHKKKGWAYMEINGMKGRLIAVTTKTFGALHNNFRLSLLRLCTFCAAAKIISVHIQS
jgi:hypothetical protein